MRVEGYLGHPVIRGVGAQDGVIVLSRGHHPRSQVRVAESKGKGVGVRVRG